MLWEKIPKLSGCRPAKPPEGFANFFLFQTSIDETAWLVGPYKDLTRFATGLRHKKIFQDYVSANQIRIGLRNGDVPPAKIKRQESYGEYVRGKNYDKSFTADRLNPMAQPICSEHESSLNRKTDRELNVKSFWESQTPQSHHIVEFNHLKALGVSRKRGDEVMDYLQLPAVLLAAEFHQRYISAILKPTHRLNKDGLRVEIAPAYRKLYLGRGKLFEPLWSISTVIIEQAGFVA